MVFGGNLTINILARSALYQLIFHFCDVLNNNVNLTAT